VAEDPSAPRASAGRPPAQGPALTGRVIAIAVVDRRRSAMENLLTRVAEAGGEAVLLTADGGRPAARNAAIQRVDLVDRERRLPLNRLAGVSPSRLVRRVAGRRGGGASWAWRRLSGSRPYRVIRPWILWRALRPMLAELAPERTDHVLLVGLESWPIVWNLLRRNETMTYSYDLPIGYVDRLRAQNGRPALDAAPGSNPSPSAGPGPDAEGAPGGAEATAAPRR